jgi:nitric oxide reductase subunit B
MTSRSNALAKGLEWNEKISKYGFWILTIGALLFTLPTYIIGMEQTRIAHDMGYYYTRLRDAVEPMKNWMWFRVVPDSMMIIGGLIIFYDLVKKTFFARKLNPSAE